MNELFDKLNVDILALGETTSSDAERLLAGVPEAQRLGRIVAPKRNVVVLHDTRRIALIGNQIELTRIELRKECVVGIHVVLSIERTIMHLIVVHWRSRRPPDDPGERYRCGIRLKDFVDDLNKESRSDSVPLIIIGDFNDEPFDKSLTEALRSTRDRAAVRRFSQLLYNPFWRVLGEHQPVERQLALGAGTHYFTKDPTNCWYTFDQALVSSSLVRGEGWTLIEEETDVIPLDRLLTENGTMRLKFDHLPILVRLAYKTSKG